MSKSADSGDQDPESDWTENRSALFRMIMEGRSFSGHERNCAFLNLGNQTFATVSAVSGFDFADDGRCVAITDWDRDGDLDTWVSNRSAPRLRLVRNDNNTDHAYLRLRLIGNGETTNRDAIGARVQVVLADGSRIVKSLRAGEGFLAQSSKWLHFGLGRARSINRVIVHWPDRDQTVQSYQGMVVNGCYELTQSSVDPVKVALDNAVLATAAPLHQTLPESTSIARVPMVTRIPMPSVKYHDIRSDQDKLEGFNSGSPILITLWASWCTPCLEELTRLMAGKPEFDQSGIRVLAIAVDEQSSDGGVEAELYKRLAGTVAGFPESWSLGHVDANEIRLIQDFHDQFFFLKSPLPLPSSFLIDKNGQLAVVYRGPVSVEQIIDDSRMEFHSHGDAEQASACLPGSILMHDRVVQTARRAQLQTRYQVAALLDERGRIGDAIEHFSRIAKLDSKSALPQRHLAKLYLRQGRYEISATHAKSAIELDPHDSRIHNTIGLLQSQRQQPRSAESYYRKAIELDPRFAEAHNNLGTVLAARGELASAGESFQAAIECDEGFGEAYTNLGSVFAALNKMSMATEAYKKAVELDSSNADAWNNLGTMYARQGDFATAIKHYRKAVRLDPNNIETRRNIERAEKLLNAAGPTR